MKQTLLPSVAALLALAALPAPALAHAKLVGSTPAANSAVSKVTAVSLKFNERLIASTVKAELVMTGMPGMKDHPPMPIAFIASMGNYGMSMTLKLKRALAPGTYK